MRRGRMGRSAKRPPMTDPCDREDCIELRVREIQDFERVKELERLNAILQKRVEAQDDTIKRFSDVWSVEEETVELRARIRRLEAANRRLAEGGRKPGDMMEPGE